MGERGADAAALCLLVGLGGDVRCPGIAWTAAAHRASTSVPRRAAAPRRATTHTWHRAMPPPHGTKPNAAANPDQQRAWWRPFLAHPRPFRPAFYAYPDRACAVLPPGARLSSSSLRQVCAPSAPRPRAPVSPVPRRCPTAVVTSPAAMPPSDVHLRERAYMHVRAREFSLVASASALLTDPRSPSLTHTVELRLLSALSRPALALSHPCSRTLRRRLPVSPSSSPLWVGGLRAAPEVQAAPGPPLSRYRWPASPLCAWMASAPPFGRSGPPSPLPPLSPTRGPPAVPTNTAPFSSSIGSISSSSLSILTILPSPLLPPCSPATSRPGGQAAGRAPSVGRLCAPSVGSSPFQHAWNPPFQAAPHPSSPSTPVLWA